MHFWKGQALGNDYLVVERTGPDTISPQLVRGLCDRHRGAGADGVLVADREARPFGLRIFNPDGTEAEKSGNGLRIFAAWLHLVGEVGAEPFRVALPGETVEMVVEGEAEPGSVIVRVAMGPASFRAGDVGFTGSAADEEVVGIPLEVAGSTVGIHPVSLGNPHCVVFPDRLDMDELRRLGPAIQGHPSFPRGVNVQLARVVGPGVLEALIWERGAGHTLASGSSACAVAAAARRAGRISGSDFIVRMEGGEVEVRLSDSNDVRLRGPAGIVYEGDVREPIVRRWAAP